MVTSRILTRVASVLVLATALASAPVAGHADDAAPDSRPRP